MKKQRYIDLTFFALNALVAIPMCGVSDWAIVNLCMAFWFFGQWFEAASTYRTDLANDKILSLIFEGRIEELPIAVKKI